MKQRDALSTPWGKSLYEGLYQLCGGAARANSALARLSANLGGIRALESHFRGPDEFDSKAVFELLAPNGNHKSNLALRRLLENEYGIKTNIHDMPDVCLDRFIAKRQEGQPRWIIEAGNKFIARLRSLREVQLAAGVKRGSTPLAWKSLELAFRYAHELMTEVASHGAESVNSIRQAEIDNFCMRRRKVFRGLGAFINHLNETSHRAGRLVLPTAPASRSSRENFMGQQAYEELVANLLQEKFGIDVRNACIALLTLLYLRRLTVVLSLRRDAISDDGNRMHIRFPGAKGADEIHPGVAALLRMWLSNWGMHSRSVNASNTPFVFPGLHPGQSMRPTAFHLWIKTRHGVLSRQLLPSGIHVMINAGMATPSALIDHYGLSHSTAVKYWTDAGRDLSQFMYLNTASIAENQGDSDGDDEAF
ncbi:hypothetical protein K3217_29760 [bacterium BD-1]|nr:hypothetical protein [Ottowia caeni]